MAENKKLETLIRLQSVITEKIGLEEQRKVIPQALNEDEASLEKAEKILSSLEEDLRQAESEEKSLTIQYTDADHQSSEYQKVIETLNTMREMEAMTKQINEADARAKALLTARNAKIQQISELKGRIEEQSAVVSEISDRVNEQKAGVEEELSKIEGKINDLENECNTIKSGVISEEFYTRFYNIAEKKGGQGLVPVKGQVCMGCNFVLPMQFVIDLRLKQLNDEVDTCPYCSRLIYFDDTVPAEEEKNFIFDDIDVVKSITKGGETVSDEVAVEDDDILTTDDSDDEF